MTYSTLTAIGIEGHLQAAQQCDASDPDCRFRAYWHLMSAAYICEHEADDLTRATAIRAARIAWQRYGTVPEWDVLKPKEA